MNVVTLILSNVRRRPLTWTFHLLTLALGVAVTLAIFLLERSIGERLSRDIAQIDLVVGAKGSPLQLILSALFQIDSPTGNILLSQADAITKNPLVASSAPVSISDNIHGLRIVGTSRNYADIYKASLGDGRWWTNPMEAVLGDEAYRTLGLKVGATFLGEHGLSAGGERHVKKPNSVVGMLGHTGTIIDRLVLTDTSSVCQVHAGETDPSRPPEVTALLVHYRSTLGAVVLPQMVKAMPNLQAAVPAIELARLNRILGAGVNVIRRIGGGLLALSGLGFFVAMFAAVNARQRELALLRILGARPA